MKDETIIDQIEPTPVLKSPRCRILALLIAWGLSYGSYLCAVAVWYIYGLFYGIAALAVAYLLIGIVRAKLRNSTIPRSQQEYAYTDRAIAAWFLSRELLCD
jgi:hypothetical protein